MVGAMARFATCLVVLLAGVAAWAGLGGAAPLGSARPGSLTSERALAYAVAARINDVRVTRGLRRLTRSQSLEQAAAAHSLEMARDGFFRHESADGGAFWRRVGRYYGAVGFRSWQVGETLLWATPTTDAVEVLRDWLNSPHHRAILLGPEWHDIGVSVVHETDAPGVFHGQEVTIVTADFGVRST